MSSDPPLRADPPENAAAPHAPVLLRETLDALGPIEGGVFLDGTFGAGGYTRAVLDAGAARVIALDRDPTALARGQAMAAQFGARLTLLESRFSALATVAAEAAPEGLDGVALDIGVSSMQLDQPARGFSFLRDGPLDMRMDAGATGAASAADLVADASEAALADILYRYGEERAARRIAKALVAARAEAPIETTARLAEIVSRALPRPKPGQPHPATRSFQALRIAVNHELDELAEALAGAERALKPGGRLVVVTFHSLEDRIVKRFFQERTGRADRGSRHLPTREGAAAGPNGEPTLNTASRRQPGLNRDGSMTEGTPSFAPITRKAQTAGAEEIAANPRARSAKLRAAQRTAAPPQPLDAAALGVPEDPRAGPRRGDRRRR